MNPDGTRKRRKRNRWGDANNKAAGLMGLTTAILSNMTAEQLDAYTLNLRIEEISAKLRINDVVPADADRSPSPPPQYDNFGRRVNTRDQRYRKRLEEERHRLVEKAMKTIPNYTPPQDYRRPNKTQEKIYVPVNDYPEINFSKPPSYSYSGNHTKPFLSRPTYRTSRQHAQEDGIRIRCQDCYSWQRLCQGRQRAFRCSSLKQPGRRSSLLDHGGYRREGEQSQEVDQQHHRNGEYFFQS